MNHTDLSTEDFQVNVVFHDIQIKKIVISHMMPGSEWERAPSGPSGGTGGRTPVPAARLAGHGASRRERRARGVPDGAYLAAIRDFESDHRITEGPRRGPWMVPVVGLEPTLL